MKTETHDSESRPPLDYIFCSVASFARSRWTTSFVAERAERSDSLIGKPLTRYFGLEKGWPGQHGIFLVTVGRGRASDPALKQSAEVIGGGEAQFIGYFTNGQLGVAQKVLCLFEQYLELVLVGCHSGMFFEYGSEAGVT